MKIALAFSPINPSTALRTSLMLFAGVAALSLLVLPTLFARDAVRLRAPAAQVSEARLAKGTEGLLRQAALHLSRLESGKSVGGFQGFEPPKDDKEYQRKIRDRAYNAQDVNDWVKEINNFLSQILKKNPGMSLEKILQEQGLTESQVDDFVGALKDLHYTADGMKGSGVSAETVARLETLMEKLRVPTWSY